MMLMHSGLFLLLFLAQSHGDTFTSIREMENLFDLEQNLVKALDNYLKHANFEIEVMELHYNELSKIEAEIQDIDKYAENPINAYSVIKRMHYDWPVTFKLMSTSPFFDEEPEFPEESDLSEAIARLVQWQTEKKLETKTLAQGLYDGIMPHANLTAFDCLEIAKYCYNKDKKLAVQWLQEALNKIEESSGGSARLLIQILEYTFLAKCLTDDMEGSVSAFQSLVTDGAFWYTPSARLSQDYKLDKVIKCEAAARKNLKTKKTITTSLFKRFEWSTELCHSERRSTKSGKCYVITDFEGAKFLKFEDLEVGDVQIIHDFLPHDLILDIKQSAMEEFKTLKSQGLNGPVSLSNRDLAAILDKRVNFVLGMSLKMMAQDQQIFVHGPGGKQTSLKSFKKQVAGSRLGSLYYFMSDVAQGGNVVFPDYKLSIEPKKGSLLIWPDENNVEVQECPVVVGSKWTMTQTVVSDEE